MLDMPLRRLAHQPLHMVASALAPLMPANSLTLIGFIVGLFCFSALAAGAWLAALPLLLLNRLIDALDGPVAQHRPEGPTVLGGYLDILTDLVFYGGFIFFFAIGAPAQSLAACFLLFCFMVCAASYIAGSLIPAPPENAIPGSPARRNNIFSPQLVESTETTIVFALMCIMPFAFTILAGILGLLTLATAAINVAAAFSRYRHYNADALNRRRPHDTRPVAPRQRMREELQDDFTRHSL